MLNRKTKELLQVAFGPPTDLDKFGKALGVVEVERKDLKVDGMVLPKGSGYKVILNSNKAARSRFSWAHELGHIIVQSGSLAKPQFRGAPPNHKQLEDLCDEIAAEILMPEEKFREQMEQVDLELTAVPRLARVFDSSILSTAIRFKDFLPFPAALSQWSIVSGQLTHNRLYANGKCRPYRYGLPKGNKAKGVNESGPQRAFNSSDFVRTEEPLMCTKGSWRSESFRWVTFPTESKAFGYGGNRYVLSLHYIEEPSN